MISKKQEISQKMTLILTLNFNSEERTSSTHALTMYRHNTVVDGKEYKIGKQSQNTA